jgi:ABC-type branched-subunit amino acid transport system ATPase component
MDVDESITAGEPAVTAPGAEPLMVTDARRGFGGVIAVDDVDLTVWPGTVHALIGPNGSGKTTLLNLISGFYRMESGRVEVAGRRVDGHGPAHVARSGVARTFQTPKLLGDKDVRYNVVVATDFSTQATTLESVFRLPCPGRP